MNCIVCFAGTCPPDEGYFNLVLYTVDMDNSRKDRRDNTISRRQVLRRMGIISAGAASGFASLRYSNAAVTDPSKVPELRGRINHSLVSWPFRRFGGKWDLDTTCRVARDSGCKSVELVGPDDWPTLAKYGLECAIAPNGTGYVKGLNNTDNHEEVIERTRRMIEAASMAPVRVHSVIAFTGFKYRKADDPSSGVISLEEGAGNTVAGLKKLIPSAERHGINIYLEHLNTRVENDDSRGHPGYQGDDIDYCSDIIRRVGSPCIKLLFDIYHVQIMNGDIISRIREYGTDLIGHIHTAGVPGRSELDDSQEIQYRPIMQSLVDIGYTGFVGHEFIPTRDPLEGIREAIAVCDV